MSLPTRSDFDTIDEWVRQVAEYTDVPQDVLWEIVEEFKPGARVVSEGDKYTLLRRLLEHHEQYMVAHLDAHGQPDADCKIQLFHDDDVIYEFMYPTHNVVKLNQSQKEAVREIINHEDMEIQAEGDRFLAAFLPDGAVADELRVMGRILRGVHNLDVAEIDRAIELRGRDEFAWTDIDELQQNVEHIPRTEGQSDQSEFSPEGFRGEQTSSARQQKEYDSWIFCQSCGDRIQDPDTNPRFCAGCRT